MCVYVCMCVCMLCVCEWCVCVVCVCVCVCVVCVLCVCGVCVCVLCVFSRKLNHEWPQTPDGLFRHRNNLHKSL